jgi:hypothetical protein
MKLSTRLVLLIVGCLLPILTAQVYSQVNLYAERHEQLGGLVLRQADLANAGVASTVDSVRQLALVATQFPSMREEGGRCDQRLSALRQSLPQYRFLAVLSSDGALLCASEGTPTDVAQTHLPWLTALLTTADLTVGQLVTEPAQGGRFLPIAVRMAGIGTSGDSRLLVAAVDTDWLTKHLEAARADQSSTVAQSTLFITDRDGTVVGRVPNQASAIGQPVPEYLRPLIRGQIHSIDTVTDQNGRTIVAAHVPNSATPNGLAVIDALVLPDLATDIDQATYQDLLVIGGAALVALLLAWVAGRRFIYRPTEALLLAARKWREGDLSARANPMDAGSEFSALAQSFNANAVELP